MTLDDAMRSAVTALWEAGTRHGRPPEPVPEADPWEDDDPVDTGAGWLPVVFPGEPSVVVRLHRDGGDLVLVEDQVELDVPRADIVAVVEDLLAGRAHRRGPVRRGGWFALSRLLGPLAPDLLVVTVGPPDARRTYTASLSGAALTVPSRWLLTLPPEPAPPPPPSSGAN